jgi:hypothetical protein
MEIGKVILTSGYRHRPSLPAATESAHSQIFLFHHSACHLRKQVTLRISSSSSTSSAQRMDLARALHRSTPKTYQQSQSHILHGSCSHTELTVLYDFVLVVSNSLY